MMSGRGANPILLNEKNKDWTSRSLTNPPPPTSDNILFLHYSVPHLTQSRRCMCITPSLMWVYLDS